jgi:hypothetical protein
MQPHERDGKALAGGRFSCVEMVGQCHFLRRSKIGWYVLKYSSTAFRTLDSGSLATAVSDEENGREKEIISDPSRLIPHVLDLCISCWRRILQGRLLRGKEVGT